MPLHEETFDRLEVTKWVRCRLCGHRFETGEEDTLELCPADEMRMQEEGRLIFVRNTGEGYVMRLLDGEEI